MNPLKKTANPTLVIRHVSQVGFFTETGLALIEDSLLSLTDDILVALLDCVIEGILFALPLPSDEVGLSEAVRTFVDPSLCGNGFESSLSLSLSLLSSSIGQPLSPWARSLLIWGDSGVNGILDFVAPLREGEADVAWLC